MKSLRNGLLVAAGCCSVLAGRAAEAQSRGEKPSELDLLDQYVGEWTSEVTSQPAVWTPREIKYRTSNHAEFVLNGWFLQHIELNQVVDDPDQVGKSIWFTTYDRGAGKFVTWFFQSSGLMGRS